MFDPTSVRQALLNQLFQQYLLQQIPVDGPIGRPVRGPLPPFPRTSAPFGLKPPGGFANFHAGHNAQGQAIWHGSGVPAPPLSMVPTVPNPQGLPTLPNLHGMPPGSAAHNPMPPVRPIGGLPPRAY